MKKFFLAACLIFLAHPAFAADSAKDSILDRIVHTNTLRADFISNPPALMIDPNTGAKSGIMNDVTLKIMKNMGLKLTYNQETTWATMIEALSTDQADVIVGGVWPSATRGLHADFSTAVYYSPVYAYVRAGDKRFNGDLTRANNPAIRIATLDGEMSSIIASSDFPQAQTQSLPQQADITQLILQVATGKADITFVEPAIAQAYIAKNPGTVQPVANVAPVRLFPNTYLVKKGETGLRDALNAAIDELQNSGEIRHILSQYDPTGKLFIPVQTPVSP